MEVIHLILFIIIIILFVIILIVKTKNIMYGESYDDVKLLSSKIKY